MTNTPPKTDEEMIKCHVCGKPMPLNPCEGVEDEDGLEGFIARNLPLPEKAWCSDECYQKGTLQ
jgi:hypothetical protein